MGDKDGFTTTGGVEAFIPVLIRVEERDFRGEKVTL